MIFAWLENKIPHISLVKSKMNDDILIVCTDDLVMYYLNSTVSFFISMADGKKTVGEIKNDMIRDLQWKNILTLE